jgi:hypothetical protein
MAKVIKIQARPNTYRIDNIIVDEYGEKIGAIGVAIYNVLARHADRETGICWPCIGTIAKKLRLGRTTVKKYLHILQRYDLIAIIPRYTDKGDPTSNSYIVLDPTPEQTARRALQRERLVNGYYAAGNQHPEGGQSPADLPPCLSATDPQSPAGHEQSSSLNKDNRTSAFTLKTPEKQLACPHPAAHVVHLSDNITICHRCYGLVESDPNRGDHPDSRAA